MIVLPVVQAAQSSASCEDLLQRTQTQELSSTLPYDISVMLGRYYGFRCSASGGSYRMAAREKCEVAIRTIS